MDQYKITGRIGQGAYGYVMKAKDKNTSKDVALKKLSIKSLNEGIPKSILREVMALKVLKNKYVRTNKDLCLIGSHEVRFRLFNY